MTILSEDMIMKRSKVNDLDHVKKLNCWACALEDISILSRLANVEVLTLSVNKIRTLEPLKHCHKLVELYIRNNQIASLDEIVHLKELQNLRILWLENNPCALEDNYRLKVLKYLPMLQKLDNAVVTEYEIDEASRLNFVISCQINGNNEEKVVNEYMGVDDVIENDDNDEKNEPVRLDAVLIENSDDEIEELTNRLEELRKKDFVEESLSQTKEILADRSIGSDISDKNSSSIDDKQNGVDKDNSDISLNNENDDGLNNDVIVNDNHAKNVSDMNKNVNKSEEYDKIEEISFKKDVAEFQRFSIEETNKLRAELGLKPRPVSSVRYSSSATSVQTQSSNVVSAILCLIKDLNKESLDVVIDACKQRKEELQDA